MPEYNNSVLIKAVSGRWLCLVLQSLEISTLTFTLAR